MEETDCTFQLAADGCHRASARKVVLICSIMVNRELKVGGGKKRREDKCSKKKCYRHLLMHTVDSADMFQIVDHGKGKGSTTSGALTRKAETT